MFRWKSNVTFPKTIWPLMTCYSSVLSFFFLSVCPSLAAHLKPRLSEAESGVFPILEETNHTEVSQEHGLLSLTFLYFKSRTQLPGCHTSLMIGWTISCVNPRSTAQYVHWLWSWKWRGGPFPCVTHHVIKSWRNNNHFLHHIKNHTIWLVEFGLKRSQPLLVLCLNTFLQHGFHSMHFSHLLNPLNTIFIYQKINTITILWRKCCDRSNAMVSITRTVFFWKWSLVGG